MCWCMISVKSVINKLVHQTSSFCLNFFSSTCPTAKLKKQIPFIQTNSFIMFTCSYPVLLVPSFGQLGKGKDLNSKLTFLINNTRWLHWKIIYFRIHLTFGVTFKRRYHWAISTIVGFQVQLWQDDL